VISDFADRHFEKGLSTVLSEIEGGTFAYSGPPLGKIFHMNVEAAA